MHTSCLLILELNISLMIPSYNYTTLLTSTYIFISITVMKSSLPIEKCDVAYAMNIIGGKWKIYILWKLYRKRSRFAELRRAVPGISEAILIAQLKMLEKDGLVRRIAYNEIPPHVEYELTTQAELLGEALNAVRVWGSLHREAALQKSIPPTST